MRVPGTDRLDFIQLPARAGGSGRAAALAILAATIIAAPLAAQTDPGPDTGPLPVTTPRQALGFDVGDDYQLANYTQLVDYWQTLAAESDRVRMVDIGPTTEGRRQWMAIVSSPANLARLDRYRAIARQLALAKNAAGADLSEDAAQALAREGKAVVWIDGGLHSNETAGSMQLIQMVYRMASGTDEETLRLLDDVIQLYVPANPDGIEFVADWYMREPAPEKRSLDDLPRLYHKYAGHDDNRDFYMSSMPETTNMNRQMFREWFPQIVYNHHQNGPTGTVVFIPPFRDPFNYHFDPLIPLGIEMVGTAMHSRLVARGLGGSVMRSGAEYSTWWNGGLRTVAYFHNMIGILTEIIGGPTPVDLPLVPDQQLPQGDAPLPAAPGTWHFAQSIEYEIEQNLAVLDYASRYRETLLANIYRMARNSIERGRGDSWTITPSRVAALAQAAGVDGDRRVPANLYQTILRNPSARDARWYVIPSSQPDFPTAVKFVNALIKTGVTVDRATRPFQAEERSYPAGSLVVRTDQAFRPHILDLFEPQDHPNDVPFKGGPPVEPYDITGWTLAMQMGVVYNRILDPPEPSEIAGVFASIEEPIPPPAAPPVAEPLAAPGSDGSATASYCLSHQVNDAFTLVNRLLAAEREVYWIESGDSSVGRGASISRGAFCTPAGETSRAILNQGAAQLGVAAEVLDRAPHGRAFKLAPVRVGLYDQYGGLAASGWTRWVLEQFEFPYEMVYPSELDAGGLRERFDVLIFPDGVALGTRKQPAAASIPAEYRERLGTLSPNLTVPRLIEFVKQGGTLITIGSSTALAAGLGIPVADHLTEEAPDGRTVPLPRGKFYVPGSLLRVRLDTSHPLAAGMPEEPVVFFDRSPVFRDGTAGVARVAWFDSEAPLASGWALGQQYLNGGVTVAESTLEQGKVVLFGPEITFRGQSHGTFKLLFNALLYGPAETLTLR